MMTTASVMGLGLMGTALARLLVTAGHQVTLWNPIPRLDAVPRAQGAGHPDDALHASRIAAG